MDRKRLNPQEQKDFIDILAAESLLVSPLGGRIAMIPGARDDLQNARQALQDLAAKIMDTMPYEQLLSYKKQMPFIAIQTGIKKASAEECTDGRYLDFNEINVLLEGCWDHCLMCDKDTASAKQCRLYKLQQILPFDSACSKLTGDGV